jgi:hypothetical protein
VLAIGLAADPSYFQTVLQPGWKDRFNDYWAQLQRQSLSQQQRLMPRLRQLQLPVAGWYLPSCPIGCSLTHRGAKPSAANCSGRPPGSTSPCTSAPAAAANCRPTPTAPGCSTYRTPAFRCGGRTANGVAELPALVRQAYRQAVPCAVGIVLEAFRQTSAAAPSRPCLPCPNRRCPATPTRRSPSSTCPGLQHCGMNGWSTWQLTPAFVRITMNMTC